MIIQCENCKRKFRLDDSKISPPGNTVKCSKCGHVFFVSKTEHSHEQDNLVSEETPLFEEQKEEHPVEQDSDEHIEKEESIFETPPNLSQVDLDVVEDVIDDPHETDDDIIDIPTEHQTDLEDFINQDIEGNTEADIKLEDSVNNENEGLKNDIEIADLEEATDSIENPPELFETEELPDRELSYNELEQEEINTEKSFKEDDNDKDLNQDTDNLSIEEETLDQENQITENIDEEDLEKNNEDSIQKTSRGQIIKSNTSIFTKFVYTIITIAALFIIFIASLVILIKAELLPKGSLPSLTTFVESIIPLGLNEDEAPKVTISELKSRWMNTVNGPVYVVSGLVTNESQTPVHYIKLRSEYIAADKKEFEDTFYAGNTFTDVQLKVSPIQNILSKLDQKNGDIDIENSKKLAGLNYNIQPGESIPFFTVFPADGRILGLKYKLEVIDYKEVSSD